MFQEFIALAVIVFFLLRLGWQFYKDQIPKSQFIFWLSFWLLLIYIRQIDQLAARLGFSSSGIQLLLYVAVAVIFYVIFRLRLKLAQMEKDITELTRLAAISERDKNKS